MRKLCPLLWLIQFFFLPSSILSAQGVVVEAVAEASAPEKAGVREGDVFHTWTRPANPPVNPEPASGTLESPFDWLWMEIEQAPRGIVELRGERQGEPLVVQVPIGLWAAQVRPVLPAELEDLYRRGKELVDKEQVEEGTSCWQLLAERAGERADWRLRAWIWLRIALTWDEAIGYQQAEAAYEAALRESRDPISRIAVLDAMGEFFEWQRRIDDAEAVYRSSHELKEATWGESLQVARSKKDLGELAWFRAHLFESANASSAASASTLTSTSGQRHHYAAAEEQIEEALAIEEKWAPGGIAVASSLHDLGGLSMGQDDFKKAVMYLDRSLSISRVLQPVSPAIAETLFRLGYLAHDGEYGGMEKTEPLFQQALSALGQTPSPGMLMANILEGLGVDAHERGDLVGAEDYYRRSLLMRSKLVPESPQVIRALINFGYVALERIDLDTAEECFNRSLNLGLRLAPRGWPVAESLGFLGDVARERGDSASAERYYRESLALLEDEPEKFRNWREMGNLARKLGDLEAAENYFQRSPLRIWVLRLLGEIARQRGHLEKAESYLREYLSKAQLPTSGAYQSLANVLRQTGRLQEAARYADLSIETLEAEIGRLAGSQEAEGKVRGRNDIYRDALRLQLELDHPQEAFHLLERFRAQAFLTLLAQRDLTFAVDLSPELDQERRRLAGSYDRNQLRLAELDPEKDGEAIGPLQREQAQLRRRREEIAAEMRRTSPRLANLQDPQALTFEQVREALDPGTVMLSYSVGQEQTHLFIVTPGRELQVETLEVGRQTLEKDIDRFRQLIDQTRAGSGLGAEGLGWFSRRLYNLLIEQAEKSIAAGKRIVLVPDGPLHLLPFAALIRKDGQHLVEWKPLSTVLSGTVFAELKKQRHDALAGAEPFSPQWVAFGDPWFPPRLTQSRPEEIGELRLRSFSTRAQLRWKRLPQSRREVEEIAALFPADQHRTYVDRDASEERAKAVGKNARILHFATHGYVDNGSPFDSGLVLSIPEELAEGRDNGLLQVWEIFESVRLDADLVVLSACETGIGEIRGGEGIIGLTRAFQYAGARSVLASLWRVEDEATAELMQRFYRHLRAGKAKDEALRAAQLELIRRPLRVPNGRGGWTERNAAAPYFWAALQLVGDGR
jgi:CHAT domain-containing protein/Tfp pilus assembly protein PilF